MSAQALHDQLLREFGHLDADQKRKVIAFAKGLAAARSLRGTPGSVVAQFAGHFDAHDLDEIASEIELGCEQIRPDEW